MNLKRRNFFAGAAMTAVAAASVSKVAMAALPEPVLMDKPDTAPPLLPPMAAPTTRWSRSTAGRSPGAWPTA